MQARAVHTGELHEHYAWLGALARNLVRDADLAEDLTQETMVAALAHTAERTGPLRPWLRGVLHNTLLKLRRSQRRRSDHELASFGGENELPSPAELAESAETAQVLMEEVRRLDEPYRATILLHFMQGLPAAEIARQQGLPAGTVRWRLSEARERLAARLDERSGGDRRAWCSSLGLMARVSQTGAAGGLGAATWIFAAAALVLAGLVFVAARALVTGPETHAIAARPASPAGSEAAPVPPPAALGADLALADARVAYEPTAVAAPSAAPAGYHVDAGQAVVRARFFDQSGRPLNGVDFRVPERDDAFAWSDEEGWAQIRFRPPANRMRARLLARLAGHATAAIHAELATGGWTDAGAVTMTPARSVQGRVVDGAGRPVEGATVVAVPADRPVTPDALLRGPEPWEAFDIELAETGPDGRFALTHVPQLPAVLWAATPETFFSTTRIESAVDVKDVELALGALTAERRITGVVVDLNGHEVGGVRLLFEPRDSGSAMMDAAPRAAYRAWGARRTHVETDAKGRFSFLSRAHERWDLTAEDLADRWQNVTLTGIAPGSSVTVRFERKL